MFYEKIKNNKFNHSVLVIKLNRSKGYMFFFNNIKKCCTGVGVIRYLGYTSGPSMKYYRINSPFDTKKISEIEKSASLQQLNDALHHHGFFCEICFRELNESIIKYLISDFVPVKNTEIFFFQFPKGIPRGKSIQVKQEYEERFLLTARHFVLTGEIKDYSVKCLNNIQREILICAICKQDIREKGDFPLYSREKGIICITCCLNELKKDNPENSKIFNYLLNERKKNQIIQLIKSGRADIKKLDICRVCGDLLHYPENFLEDFNEEYKICCKCQRALESKVKGLNRVRDLKRFKKYEMCFRDIFFINSKTLSKVIKVKDEIKYKK